MPFDLDLAIVFVTASALAVSMVFAVLGRLGRR